ncbi:MAG TPA: nucleotidyltransferase family protein [Planctomycetota bacterium]|nr:nucleotidyltransferase family protein [Planctomycetota bacterium]
MPLTLPPRRAEVLKLLQGQRDRLVKFAVRSLFLFGSVARDEANLASDVDLLVDFAGPPTYRGYMDLKFFLEDLLGCRVDLVTRGGLRPRALPAIEREAIRVA